MNSGCVRLLLIFSLILASTASAEAQFRRFRSRSKSSRTRTNSRHEQFKRNADQAYENGDYKRSVELAGAVLKENPRDHVAYYLRASARCELGVQYRDVDMIRAGISDARESLRFAERKNRLYYIPYIYGMAKLAEIEGQKKHAEIAVTVANQAISAAGVTPAEKAHLMFQRGGAFVVLGQYDKAIEDYDSAISLDGKLMSAYTARADAYTRAKNPEKAGESYDKLVDAFADQALVYDYRGVFLQQQGEFGDAIADFTRALELEPNYHSAYTNRGYTLLQTGEPQAAEFDFSAALEILPNQPMVLSLRGSARLAQGLTRAAIDDQRRVVSLSPGNAAAHAELGFGLYFDGRIADAMASFDEALRLDAQMRYLQPWRYLLLRESNRTEAAEKIIAAAGAKEAEDRDWVDRLLAYLADEKEEDLLTAVSKSDSQGAQAQLCEAHFFIGMRKKLAGDQEAASDHFKKSLDTESSHLSSYRGAQFALKQF